jgi:hypothetical protein
MFLGSKMGPVCRADLSAHCEPIVKTVWEPETSHTPISLHGRLGG